MKGIELIPNNDSMVEAQEYVSQIMANANIPTKASNKVSIALDEIYSNVIHYSGATKAYLRCEILEGKVILTIMDNGAKFNPFVGDAPDVSSPAEERVIGGLGIFMTMKIMDECLYKYENENNTVILIKYY